MRRHSSLVVATGLVLAGSLASEASQIRFSQVVDTTDFLAGIDGSVVIAELNGDEYLDFAYTQESRGWITLGSLKPTTSVITTIYGFDSPNALAIGDIDGDGDNDIVVGQFNNIPITGEPPYPAEIAEVLWLENPLNGPNEFWAPHPVSLLASEGMRDIELADMDRDGDLDIVEARSGGFSWAANDGTPADGGWVNHTISSTPLQPWEVEVVDMDGDGDLDIVGSDVFGDDIRWYESEDSGGDGVPDDVWSSHVIAANLDGASGVAVGDINRDGRPDVVAAAAVADQFVWFANPGWTATILTGDFDGASSVRTRDLDADGDLDILATAEDTGKFQWFENSDGTGGSWITRSIYNFMSGAVDADAGDLDGDGDLDLVVTDTDAYSDVSLWINRAFHRRFHSDDWVDVRTGLEDPRSIEVADLNGDGLEDLVTALWAGGEVKAFISLYESGTAWWEIDVASGFASARDVSTADVDNDGDLDILGAAVGADTIRWWANDGGSLPGWTAHTVVSGYNGAHCVEPADFDRDGDVDLAVAAFDADDVSWMENSNGLGTAWIRHDLGAYDGAFDLAVGDLNSDGRPDFVASAYGDDLVEYFLNSPSGGLWWVGQVGTHLDGPRGVDLGDVDLDGDLDVVVVVRNDGEILWFENDGTGTTWTEHAVGTGYFSDGAAVRVVDLDGDGDADVAATNQDENDVTVWKNDDRGSDWTKFNMEQNLDTTWDLDIGDINRDGKLDIAVAAGGTEDSLVWYPNLGDQARQRYYDTAPRVLEPGLVTEVLAILVSNSGREHDGDMRLHQIELEFTDHRGNPLTTEQFETVSGFLQLSRDYNNNGYYDLPGDSAAAFENDVTLVDGVFTWNLNDGEYVVQRRIPPGESEFFFVLLSTNNHIDPPDPPKFIINVPAGAVTFYDANFGPVLASEESEAVSTDPIALTTDLFRDGFEAGSISGWSSSSG